MLDWLEATGTADVKRRDLFIDGAWTAAQGGRLFEDREPATGALLARIADAGAADIDAAISAAARAQPGWEAMLPAARAAVFHRAAELFAERQDALVRVLIAETGSGLGKASFEASLVPLALREAAALTTREIGETGNG